MTRSHRPDVLGLDLIERHPLRRRAPMAPLSFVHLAQALTLREVDPIMVYPTGVGAGGMPARYAILHGELAWRLAQAARIHSVPVWIRDDLSPAEADALAQGDPPAAAPESPVAEARAARAVLDADATLSIAELARRTGHRRTAVSHLLRLLKLDPSVQQWVHEGRLTPGQVRPLVCLAARDQLRLAEQALGGRRSARAMERLANRKRHPNTPNPQRGAGQAPVAPAPATDPNVIHVEEAVTALLGCRTRILWGPAGAQLVVDCATLDILDGVLARIGYAGG